jgi:hypothetical protein
MVPALTSLQPAGAATVTFVELTVMKRSRVSPPCVAPGTATVWVARLPWVLAAATNPTVASVALTDLDLVTEAL